MTTEKALKLLYDMEFSEKYQGVQEYAEMLMVCKDALKKQIPMRPISVAVYPSLFKSWICPVCRQKSTVTHAKFCCLCGQALDWSWDK